jgi:hypothetical protein
MPRTSRPLGQPRQTRAAPALKPARPAATRTRAKTTLNAASIDWLLFIYRVPSEPSNNRVSVWRELKRLGALYLQQCVCIVPALPACEQGLESAVRRVESLGGSYNLFRLTDLDAAERERLSGGFRELSAKEYAEIVEECRTKFVKEIEFERYRENYTYEEAEEIREDLEKIRRWYARVVERDWFDAGQRDAVARELEQCERLLEAFEEEVYRRAGEDQGVLPAGRATRA